jgi:hypothetical protein
MDSTMEINRNLCASMSRCFLLEYFFAKNGEPNKGSIRLQPTFPWIMNWCILRYYEDKRPIWVLADQAAMTLRPPLRGSSCLEI